MNGLLPSPLGCITSCQYRLEASTGKKEAVLSLQEPRGFLSFLTLEVRTPPHFGLAVTCHSHEVVNGIQHMSVGRGNGGGCS